jgi:hypothetical protein
MRLTEDALRAALKATGDEFPAHQLPELMLPAQTPGRRVITGRRWLAAAAAVIAVLAILAASLLLASGARPVRPVNPLTRLPAYYVALQEAPGCQCDLTPPDSWLTDPDRALVQSKSGRTLAIVTPPRPYGTFAAVRAAADDRTFVLAAQQSAFISQGYPATRFYLLRIHPFAAPGQRAVLTALPVPVVPAGTIPFGIALSPDGTRFAELSCAEIGPCPARLHVYDLGSDASRSWTVPFAGRQGFEIGSEALSWAADNRTIGIALERSGAALALLDTTAHGATFGADAEIIQLQHLRRGHGLKLPPEVVTDGVLTPDGRHVLESVANLRILDRTTVSNPAGVSVRQLSLATERSRPELRHAAVSAVWWTDPTGAALLAAAAVADQGGVQQDSPLLPKYAVLETPQGTARVPIPAGTLAMAW